MIKIEWTCDICGKPMANDNPYRKQFRIKAKFDSQSVWHKFDVCQRCMDEIVRKIKDTDKAERK